MRTNDILKENQIDIDRIINNINAGKYNKEQLLQIKKNAEVKGDVGLKVLQAADAYLRNKFTPKSKGSTLARGAEYKALLEKFYNQIEKEFPLYNNKTDNGVKAGLGSLRTGDKYIDWFMTYKNSKHNGIYIGILQNTPTSEPYVRIGPYNSAMARAQAQDMPISDLSKAIEIYKTHLAKIIEN